MPIAFDTLRTGKRYKLINYGEETIFEVMKIYENDIQIRDLNSLENFPLSLLVKYGKGKDYDLFELDE